MSTELYDDVFDRQQDITNQAAHVGCEHTSRIEEDGLNICIDCGEELERRITHDKEWRYYGLTRSSDPNRAHARKLEDKNIHKDVMGMDFSQQVVTKADEFYSTVTNGKIYRGGSRKSIVFACVYHAYKSMGNPKTPESLIPVFGISRKDGLKGLKMVNINIPHDSDIHNTQLSLENIIKDMMSRFTDDPAHTNEVILLYKRTDNRSSKLNRARPQSVAAALIYLWITKKNININIDDFARLSNLSQLTIHKNMKELNRILQIVK